MRTVTNKTDYLDQRKNNEGSVISFSYYLFWMKVVAGFRAIGTWRPTKLQLLLDLRQQTTTPIALFLPLSRP
jgi:hypothetical protein